MSKQIRQAAFALGLAPVLAIASACASSVVSDDPAPIILAGQAADPPLSAILARRLQEKTPDALDIWVLDVGQGSCVVVDCPDEDRPIVVDCGTSKHSALNQIEDTIDLAQQVLAEDGPPSVVISHGDRDHHSLLDDLLSPDQVRDSWIGGARAQYAGAVSDWLNDVEATGGAVHTFADQAVSLGHRELKCGSAISDVLIANATSGSSKNGDSIVLAITYAGTSVILAGDAEGETEAHAITSWQGQSHLEDSRSIVIGSHHGADTHGSNGKDWAKVLAPYAVVFSAHTEHQTLRHPRCSVVRRYFAQMVGLEQSFRLTCGNDGRPRRALVNGRGLTTYDNGHILIRIQPERIAIYCQAVTPACAGELPGTKVS